MTAAETESAKEKDRADVRARQPTARAETLKATHIHPAATTGSARERTDTLEEEETDVEAAANGTETEALNDETAVTSRAEAESAVIVVTCSMSAEEAADEAAAIAKLADVLLLLPKDAAPALRESPRSLPPT